MWDSTTTLSSFFNKKWTATHLNPYSTHALVYQLRQAKRSEQFEDTIRDAYSAWWQHDNTTRHGMTVWYSANAVLVTETNEQTNEDPWKNAEENNPFYQTWSRLKSMTVAQKEMCFSKTELGFAFLPTLMIKRWRFEDGLANALFNDNVDDQLAYMAKNAVVPSAGKAPDSVKKDEANKEKDDHTTDGGGGGDDQKEPVVEEDNAKRIHAWCVAHCKDGVVVTEDALNALHKLCKPSSS